MTVRVVYGLLPVLSPLRVNVNPFDSEPRDTRTLVCRHQTSPRSDHSGAGPNETWWYSILLIFTGGSLL